MAGMLTPAEVGALWGMSARHVRRLCSSGELRAMKSGSDWRISSDAARAYEAAHTSGSDSSTSNEGRKPEAARKEHARPTPAVDGFTLPDDYTPVFPSLWPGHEARPVR